MKNVNLSSNSLSDIHLIGDMKVDMSGHTKDNVKIDAMFFTTTEEPMVLLGHENPDVMQN